MKELLSAFYDDELSSEKRTAVAEHLARCDGCTCELDGFQNLSVMAKRLTHPEPPTHIWQQLEQQLAVERGDKSKRPTFLDWRRATRKPAARIALATAAAILLVAGWFGYKSWFGHDANHQMATVFGEYLEEFRHDPIAAQEVLLANYKGQAIDAEQAMHTVGYRPAVANGMPDGYTIDKTYVMKMPCCTCVQCLCQRSDRTTIVVFEHDDEETNWFGDRPHTETMCNGTPCSLVQLDDRIAASWQRGKRHITVIGVRDTEEIGELVAWFDGRTRVGPQ